MKDDDLTRALERSVDHKVRKVAPRADMERLLTRWEQRSSRQRRWLVGLVALVLVGGTGLGFVLGRGSDDSSPGRSVVMAASDGVPDAPVAGVALEPADPDAARAAIAQAFHQGLDGGVVDALSTSAYQDGESLSGLRRDALALLRLHGYTDEQIAGLSVTVLDSTFIDENHAAVRFTLAMAGRGDILVDQVGYAVFDRGRWKITLRTACDLLSLSGLGKPCPPSP